MIKIDMEIPESCAKCKGDIEGYCILTDKPMDFHTYFEERLPTCLLIEVKE